MDVSEWIARSVKQNASDLNLCSGYPPILRIDGELKTQQGWPGVASARLEAWCRAWLTPEQLRQLQAQGQVDGALEAAGGVRLRVNLFRQRRGLSAALRLIPARHRTLADLQAPDVLASLITLASGLILVTGATGSGKSTTLAALVGELNRRYARHVITLEDPIEGVYPPGRSLIQQREIGAHCASFALGLRAALREDPDVILLGELRDAETIRLALTAAETGHLVLATLHTRGAPQAVERLVDVFCAEEKSFVRAQLAMCLQAVVAQTLTPLPSGGRIALFEVLVATPAVGNLIREGKTHQLPGLLQLGGNVGMQTFEQSRQQRRRAGLLRAEPSLERRFTAT